MNDYVFWAIMVIAVGFMLYNRFANKADPDQAHRLVESGATLLDVRSPSEFSGGHIDGAINIPVGELAGRLSELPARGSLLRVRQSQRRGDEGAAGRRLRDRARPGAHERLVNAQSAW